MVISSIQHNQISKIKFYIILNVKKKEKKSIKIRKLLLSFFFKDECLIELDMRWLLAWFFFNLHITIKRKHQFFFFKLKNLTGSCQRHPYSAYPIKNAAKHLQNNKYHISLFRLKGTTSDNLKGVFVIACLLTLDHIVEKQFSTSVKSNAYLCFHH
jgi:hypothetical protein